MLQKPTWQPLNCWTIHWPLTYAGRLLTSKLKGLLARVAIAAMGIAAMCNAGELSTPSQSAPAPFVAPRLSDSNAADFNILSAQSTTFQQSSFLDPAVKAGNAALTAKAFELAIADYSKELAVNPTSFPALWGRAAAHAGLQENAQAQADYDSALSFAAISEKPNILVAMARFHMDEKRPDLAVEDIDEWLRVDPNNAKFLVMRGQIYVSSKQFAKAYADFTKVIDLFPDSPDGHIFRGSLFRGEKRYAEALEDVSEAIVLEPSIARQFLERALILDKMDRFQAELGDLQTAIRLSPTDPEVLNDLAWLLATCPEPTLRDGNKAVDFATRAAELSHWEDGPIIDTLAAACAQIGVFKTAAGWQRKAIALTADKDEQAEMQRRLESYDAGKAFVESSAATTAIAWETLRYQTFDTVWQTVNDSYYDPKFSGVNWAALRDIYRQKLDAVNDNGHLRELLGQMLGELHRTHFGVIPKEGAVFNPSEQIRIGSTGAELTAFSNRPAVTTVVKGSPAAVSGLRPGDVISSVNGRSLNDVATTLSKAGFQKPRINAYLLGYVESQMTSAVGSSLVLGVDHADGSHNDIRITCGPTDGPWSEPIGYFPSMPIHTNIRKDGPDIGIIKFNVFVPPVMRQIRVFMKSLDPESGLVIDLRGNPGGITAMAAGICGLLCSKEVSLGSMHLRDSTMELEVYPSSHPFAGPVAVLIDSRSASTSEMLAAGIHDIGRARLFGEKSPGMALPSLYKELPTGDLFQYAIADYTTELGTSLEGGGVDPDVTVVQTRDDLVSGHDATLDAAEAWIRTKLQAKQKAST
jgi:carboxyl-terminal processing protease